MVARASGNPYEFLLPDLGEGLEEAELVEWCVRPGDGRVLAAPAVGRLARELGVDIEHVTGTGIGGRVTARDVEAAAGAGARQDAREEQAPPPPPRPARAPAPHDASAPPTGTV